MTVIAFDPGVTTGIAIHTDGNYQTLVIKQDFPRIAQLIEYNTLTCVVFEDFNTAGRIDTHGLFTVRLIGQIEAYCYKLGIPTLVQFPPERKQFIDDARSILNAGGKKWVVHEMDALAHLLVYEHRLAEGTLERIMSTRRRIQ